jgi:uncharacterized protein YuzE
MKFTYDTAVDAAYIALQDRVEAGAVAFTYACDPQEVHGQIHLDFDERGRLLGIEVLGASRMLPAELLKAAADSQTTWPSS